MPLGVNGLQWFWVFFPETKAIIPITEWVFRYHPRLVFCSITNFYRQTNNSGRGWTQNSGSASLFTKHGAITGARMFFSGGQLPTTLVFTQVKCFLYGKTSLSTEITSCYFMVKGECAISSTATFQYHYCIHTNNSIYKACYYIIVLKTAWRSLSGALGSLKYATLKKIWSEVFNIMFVKWNVLSSWNFL